MKCNPRTTLPTLQGSKQVRNHTGDMRRNIAERYNFREKDLPVLKPGQSFRFHNGEDWSRRAKILENYKNDRSYVLETDQGTTI